MDANSSLSVSQTSQPVQIFYDLCLAAQNGDILQVQEILPLDQNTSLMDALTPHLGITALMLAAERGNLNVVYWLIQKQANLNIISHFGMGYTALMYAIAHGHFQVAEALLKAKADPCISNLSGDTACGIAELNGDSKMSELLNKHIPTKNKASLSGLFNKLACWAPSFDLFGHSDNTPTIANHRNITEAKKEGKKPK